MEGIEFEKEVSRPSMFIKQEPPKQSWVIRLVMKISGGHIKTEEQASKVLIIATIIFFLLSIYNFFF
ncbi:MAG: hypothetical protein AAB477_02075 [Patescibacteria group bacterium]